MKTLKSFSLALALLSLVACTKTGEGRLRLLVAPQDISVETRGNVGDYTTIPQAADFDIAIKGPSFQWNGKLGSWDTATKLKVGNYTVSAACGTEGEEGFDKPFFSGSANFAIEGEGNTDVNIPVSLQNCIVRISTTENFRKYYPEAQFTITTPDSEFSYPSTETRGIFIEAARFSLSGSLKKQDGSTANFAERTFNSLKPATCYTVAIDVANAGGFSITITFNDSTETVEFEEELND